LEIPQKVNKDHKEEEEQPDDEPLLWNSDSDLEDVQKKDKPPLPPATSKQHNKSPGGESDTSSSSEEEDEWGKFIEVMSFNWKTKKFLIRWERGRPRTHRATDVLEDWPEEALEVLWRDHRMNLNMRTWVDKIMSKKDSGYLDIESYAAQRQWEGSYDPPAAAAKATVGLKGM
jgi:hypothetical protein